MSAPVSSSRSPRIEFVDLAARLAEVAERLSRQDVIAFDTEFLRERTFYPQLALIQVADRECAWVIDPLAVSREAMRPLLDVFTSPNTLKAAHAVEQDQECLHRAYGLTAEPVLDTAVAAALTGNGDQIGLAALLQKLLGVRLAKGHTRTNWMKRPLPEAMVEYAADDVAYLVDAAERLSRELRRLDRRDWALSLSAGFGEAARAEFDADAMTRKLAARSRLNAAGCAVLKELIVWRERRVRQKDIPRSWLADDGVLVKLAAARPRSAEELRNFRGLGVKLIERGAEPILAAIRRGEATPPEERGAAPREEKPTADEAAALTVLKCFLTALAAENKVPLRYLVDENAMRKLLRGRFASPDDLRASGLLKPEAADIMGGELAAVLNGGRALRLVNGRAERWRPGEEG